MLLVFLGLVKASACRLLCIVLSLFLSLKVLQIYSQIGIYIYLQAVALIQNNTILEIHSKGSKI